MPQDKTPLTMVEQGTEFELLGSEDRSAFVLRFKTDGLTAQLAGDDAARFRADYETIRTQYPGWKADQTLAQLWDQGGYSWLAAQDG
jgi:hypothetical protein